MVLDAAHPQVHRCRPVAHRVVEQVGDHPLAGRAPPGRRRPGRRAARPPASEAWSGRARRRRSTEPGDHRGGVALADVGREPPPRSSSWSARSASRATSTASSSRTASCSVDAARSPARQLDARRQQGQRGAQLVAGVVDELALALQRLLEGVEHLVEGVPSRVTSSSRPGGTSRRSPVGPAGDLGGPAPVALDRAQRGPGEPVADEGGDRPARRARRAASWQQQLAQRLVAVVATDGATRTRLARAGERGDPDPVAARPRRAGSVPTSTVRTGPVRTCRASAGERAAPSPRGRRGPTVEDRARRGRAPATPSPVASAVADVGHGPVGADQRRDGRRGPGEVGVEPAVERVLDAPVDEGAGRGQQHQHRGGEARPPAAAAAASRASRRRRRAAHPGASSAVAGAAHGGDGRGAERAVDLGPDGGEVDVDDVAAQVGLAVPHLVEDGEARDHRAGPGGQQVQHVELPGGQLDLRRRRGARGARRGRRPGRRPSTGDPVVVRAPAAQRPQPGEQLVEVERLGQVVVGAGVEAGDAVAAPRRGR